ncbi:FAD-binding protein [Candidatus Nitrotoga sp. 1052]|uniref:FAD-binding protein n=1 Tax=Candidatus Nitrotoga sp. 1052 TaxID=2886964 RepID=UPI001EF64D8C|nr:FAD-binding protein [Candidatus Nitrotoga sp. 1052]
MSYDVAIIGAGSAGLACAVYAASEGLIPCLCSTLMRSAVRRARARESKISSVSRLVSPVRRSPDALMFRRRNSVLKWWCPSK